MPTSDEDLRKKQQHVAKLREQVAAEQTKRVTRERELANDVTMAQLEAEEVRLLVQLEQAKESNKVSAVKDGAQAPLQSAREQMVAAQEQQKAQERRTKEQEKARESAAENDKENS